MTKVRQAPRVSKILNLEGFNVVCQFTTGESRVIDFSKLLDTWAPKEGDPEFALLDLQNFQKIELHDGILTWPNVLIKIADWQRFSLLKKSAMPDFK